MPVDSTADSGIGALQPGLSWVSCPGGLGGLELRVECGGWGALGDWRRASGRWRSLGDWGIGGSEIPAPTARGNAMRGGLNARGIGMGLGGLLWKR